MIIGLSGKINSGKDTVGEIIRYLIHKEKRKKDSDLWNDRDKEELDKLREEYNKCSFEFYLSDRCRTGGHPIDYWKEGWEIMKFGGKLKDIVCILTGCTREDLESQEFKEKVLPREWWTYTYFNPGIASKPKFQFYPKYASDEIIKELGEDEIFKPTYRWLLQNIGTEAMRNVIGDNVWVNALFSEYKSNKEGYEIHEKYKDLGGYGLIIGKESQSIIDNELIVKEKLKEFINEGLPNWIITDCRFPNELKAIKDRNGIMIRVNRKEFITTEIEGGMKVTEIKGSFASVMKLEHPSEISLDGAKFDYYISNDGTIEELVEKVKEILIKEKMI